MLRVKDVPVGDHAVRRDPETGVVEEAGYLDLGDRALFRFTHRPPRRPAAGLVICSPILYEQLKFYRTEVLLARRLAGAGIATLRFHYRGCGHSLGPERPRHVQELVEDTLAMTSWFKRTVGIDAVAYLGTRLGGMVASRACIEDPRASLVLCEPVIEGVRYRRELLRVHALRRLQAGVTVPQEAAAGAAGFSGGESAGCVDVLGFKIDRSFMESLLSADRAPEVANRAVLLCQLRRSAELCREYASLMREMQARGCDVDSRCVQQEMAWWFERLGDASDVPGEIVAAVAEWLVRRVNPPSSMT